MTVRIATVGDNCIDRYLPPVDRQLVGGNAVNVAVNLRRLGHDAAYFGAVGDDAEGRRVRAVLAKIGVDIAALKTVSSGRTSLTTIATGPDGERHFMAEDFGVCRGYRPDAIDLARLKTMRHVHIGWLDDGGSTKRALADEGISVSQDLSVNAAPENISPDALSIAFASCDGSAAEGMRLARQICRKGARLAVILRGAQGSLALAGDDIVSGEALPVAVSDTTGAGDSFIAGFLSAHLNDLPITQCLARGHREAARTCQFFGGFIQD
ncbi:fructoselysine 6-kinase [Nordella sp. HKS 07]|uniref:PfkB family carbohydrate kinase n=1 Tax=Nordella sp. HKS 07 TaxID=2712222 RepID=UPI0013E16EB4|nr:PfkB family carbohydrate kinase [Nordella sp. HKS 07]QIG48049.1 fructoselysine 6-kinase [Nordella sp. HKS 07]